MDANDANDGVWGDSADASCPSEAAYALLGLQRQTIKHCVTVDLDRNESSSSSARHPTTSARTFANLSDQHPWSISITAPDWSVRKPTAEEIQPSRLTQYAGYSQASENHLYGGVNPVNELDPQPSLITFCDGIDFNRVSSYATSLSPAVQAYFRERFGVIGEKCFCHKCIRAVQSTRWRQDKWKQVRSYMMCPACHSFNKHIDRHLAKLNGLQESFVRSNQPSSIVPTTSQLKQAVTDTLIAKIDCHDTRSEAFVAFQNDQHIHECLAILKLRGDTRISVHVDDKSDRIIVNQCGTTGCDQIQVLQERELNAEQCQKCRSKIWNEQRSANNRELKHDERVKHDSKTKISSLTGDELKERMANRRSQVSCLKSNINTLENRLKHFRENLSACPTVPFDGSGDTSFLDVLGEAPRPQSNGANESLKAQHEVFMEEMTDVANDIVENEAEFRKVAEKTLEGLFEKGFLCEKSDNSKNEFNKADVEPIINFMMEQMVAHSKCLNGKVKQVKPSPELVRLSFALWSASPQIEVKLPSQNLRKNRTCSIYLVEVLKTLFDSCVQASVKEIVLDNHPEESKPFDRNSNFFISSVQNIMGAAIAAAKREYCPSENKPDATAEEKAILTLFKNLYFYHDVASKVAPEYEKYYPKDVEFANQGGLHLVHLSVIEWAIEVMHFIASSYQGQDITVSPRQYIAVKMASLKNTDSLYDSFNAKLGAANCLIDDETLRKIHTKITLYAFRAGTKTTETDAETKATGSDVMAALGVKPPAKKRRMAAELTDEKQKHYKAALPILRQKECYNPVLAKLNKNQCIAVLELGFNIKGKSAELIDSLRTLLKNEIDKGPSSAEFWNHITIKTDPQLPIEQLAVAQWKQQKQQMTEQTPQMEQDTNQTMHPVLPIPPPQLQIPYNVVQQNLMFPQQQQPNAHQAMSLMPQLPPISIPQLPNNVLMHQNQMWQQPFMNTTAAAMQQNQQPINPYRQNQPMNPYNQNPCPNPANLYKK